MVVEKDVAGAVVHVYVSMCTYGVEPNGVQRQRWGVQQRAFSRMLPLSFSTLCVRQLVAYMG